MGVCDILLMSLHFVYLSVDTSISLLIFLALSDVTKQMYAGTG